MKNISLCVLSLVAALTICLPARAQYYYYNNRFYDSDILWLAGLSGGGMNCLTDLGGKQSTGRSFLKDLEWQMTKPVWTIYTSMVYKRMFGLRVEYTRGKVAGRDKVILDKALVSGRFIRNLSFQSSISEWLLLAETFPLAIFSPGLDPVISPYFLTGAGCFWFDPYTQDGAEQVRLHPLRTEGQGFPEFPERPVYSLRQWNVGLGIGLRYEASALLIFAAEVLYRKLFTDYLDDVSTNYIDPYFFHKNLSQSSAIVAARVADRQHRFGPAQAVIKADQRGNPANKDAYFSFSVKAGLVLNREKRTF